MPYNHRRISVAFFALLVVADCAPAVPGPTITVEAVYPGANAQVLADTVAAPIEQQVNGVEQARSMHSRCTSDGRYVLTVAFADGADAAMAQVLVQNRVALALPLLPEAVNNAGVTVRPAPSDVLFVVVLSSPEGRFDQLYMSRFAAVQLKDELARLPGVGAVMLRPAPDDGLRVWLDPVKVAALGMTAADVARTLREQNFGVDANPPVAGQKDARIDVKSLGRLVDLNDFQGIILKAGPGGGVVRLGQVARVERLGGRADRVAQLNGKDAALLFVAPLPTARPDELKVAVTQRLADLEKHLPEGLRLDLAFDFTANLENPGHRAIPEYLLLDLDVPPDTTPARAAALLDLCAAVVSDVEGVKDVLSLSDNPFDAAPAPPSILLRLPPLRERKLTRAQVAEAIRTRLRDKVADVAVRMRFPFGTGPGWGYPIDLAIHGPDAVQVRKLAAKLAERLREDKQLTDVWFNPATEPRPQLNLDIDREQAAKRGVAIDDIQATLQMHLAGAGKAAKEFELLKVRNQQGEMVALAALVRRRTVLVPAVVDRFDLEPMVAITANPGAELAAAQVRVRCERLAAEVRQELGLPASYCLSWRRPLPK